MSKDPALRCDHYDAEIIECGNCNSLMCDNCERRLAFTLVDVKELIELVSDAELPESLAVKVGCIIAKIKGGAE